MPSWKQSSQNRSTDISQHTGVSNHVPSCLSLGPFLEQVHENPLWVWMDEGNGLSPHRAGPGVLALCSLWEQRLPSAPLLPSILLALPLFSILIAVTQFFDPFNLLFLFQRFFFFKGSAGKVR